MQYSKFLRKEFVYLKEAKFMPSNGILCPLKKITISMLNEGKSYCFFRNNIYHIVLDRLFFFDKIKEFDYPVGNKEFDQIFEDTMYPLVYFYYHEVSHALFSSFNSLELMPSTYTSVDKNWAMFLLNVLEDPFVECQLLQIKSKRKEFRFFRKYFNSKYVEPKALQYKDNGDASSLYFFILYGLTLGRKVFTGTNKFFDEHDTKCTEFIERFFSEVDGDKRPLIAFEFYDYLKSEGLPFPSIDEESFARAMPSVGGKSKTPTAGRSMVVRPKKLKNSEEEETSSEGENGTSGGSNAKAEEESEPNATEVNTQEESNEEEEFDTEVSSASQGGTPEEESNEESEEENDDDDDNDDDILDDMTIDIPTSSGFESYNESLIDMYTHEFVDLASISDIHNEEMLSEYVYNAINKHFNLIHSCMDKINEFQSMNRSYPMAGYSSGKFDMRSYVKGERLLKCFTRPSGIEPNTDICFYCLVDMSGSMHGKKSILCTESMIVLYECLARLGSTFEYGAFTNFQGDGSINCLTYLVKRFEDDAELRKKYLPFTSSDYVNNYNVGGEYSTFNCNYEEVNLSYCLPRLKAQSIKNKVMIILCDGCTCGDVNELKKVVEQAEQDGILVLCVGIACDRVSEIYPHHVIFSNTDDLENFPAFLEEFLVNRIINN